MVKIPKSKAIRTNISDFERKLKIYVKENYRKQILFKKRHVKLSQEITSWLNKILLNI